MNNSALYEDLFYRALLIRLVEEKIIELYPSDQIQSPVHLSIGQEAVAVGACYDLTDQDLIFCTYRSHSFYLAKGGDLKEMFAELCGKVTGCGKGKAGSMHLLAPKVGMMLSSAVVASTIPHGVGAAMAARHLKKNQIILNIFGDGATEEGVFHESLNFAALHKVPCIFLCENNGFAVHSKLSDRQSYKIENMVKTYGLKYTLIEEGYDFMAVREAMQKVYAEFRETRMPHFVEVKTFRYKEHVGTGNDFYAGYRSEQELASWLKCDPLHTDKEMIKKWTPLVMEKIDEAVRFAQASPFPGRPELLADVY